MLKYIMTRSKDLDTIAPDDLIAKTPSPSKEVESSDESVQLRQKICQILDHTKNCFSSFIVNPSFFDFPEREDDEEIFLAVRPHWATNFSWVITTIGMILIPLVLNYLNILNFLPIRYQIVSVLFWYLITFIFAFEKFLHWYFDIFFVTNKRLVDISFNNMLNKHFAEADIDRIQDISSSVLGLFGTFFNFGSVLVQTASEIDQINFENIPNPEKIIEVIQKLREANGVN